jgi:RNA polymerase sigma-70 factor (ECF subfamily)
MAAEDIVSESLINLWQVMKNEGAAHPHALLLTILRNEALNYLKHEEVRMAGLERISLSLKREMNYRIANLEACDPEEIFSAEITEIVERTLQSLSPQTLRIFKMSRYEHLPVKEIARILNTSPKSVEYHITQALKALRISLKEYLSAVIGLLNFLGL